MMKALLVAILLCGLLLLADYTAMAQTHPSACSLVDGPTLHVSQVSPRTGCPFSAIIEITHNQTLADGTNVGTKTRNVVYRDSLGRIREEMYAPGQESPTVVEISDPVEGLAWTIQPPTRTASHSKLGAVVPLPVLPKIGVQPSATPPAPNPTVSVEDLGSHEMEGLLVMGSRTTVTFPAGSQGNDRAIRTVKETWLSSDMGITLLEKHSDPRSGDIEERMTNLEQAEPDPALFQVPADYTIKDQ